MLINQFKRYIFILVPLLTISLGGCASYKAFNTLFEEQMIKPGSIVVIAGSPDETDIRLAELITEKLSKNPEFTVISQDEVFEKFPAYPAEYEVDGVSKNGKKVNIPPIPEDVKSDIAKYQQKFKTRYVLLVWSEDMKVFTDGWGFSSQFDINFESRLIEYPGNSVIGYSSFATHRGGGCSSCFTNFYTKNTNIDKLLDKISQEVVQELLKKTRDK